MVVECPRKREQRIQKSKTEDTRNARKYVPTAEQTSGRMADKEQIMQRIAACIKVFELYPKSYEEPLMVPEHVVP